MTTIQSGLNRVGPRYLMNIACPGNLAREGEGACQGKDGSESEYAGGGECTAQGTSACESEGSARADHRGT